MDIRRYANLIRRWAWLLVALPIVAGAVAYSISLQLPKVYVAQGQMLVRPLPPPTATGGPVTPLNPLTLAQLVTEPPVMKMVVGDLGLNVPPGVLAGQFTVGFLPGNEILQVIVSDSDPQRAAAIANTGMTDFIAQLKADQEKEAGRALDAITVVSPAVPPGIPVSPRPKTNTLVAAAAGLMIAIALIALLEYLDQTVRSDDEILARTGLQILGHVPFVGARKEVRGELDAVGKGGAAEAYRSLRTNLEFASLDNELKTILVTSSISGEGKTRLAANLATALAGAGRRTLIIDADLRRPRQHTVFGRVRNTGLSDLLIGDATEQDAIRPVEGVPNLWLLPSGGTPFDPTLLLSSQKTKALIARLGAGVDHVVIDSPPVTAVADPLILAADASATIVAVEVGRTTRSQLIKTREALGRARARIVGVVVTKVKAGRDGYGYGYGYGYGSYASRPEQGNDKHGPAAKGIAASKRTDRQSG